VVVLVEAKNVARTKSGTKVAELSTAADLDRFSVHKHCTTAFADLYVLINCTLRATKKVLTCSLHNGFRHHFGMESRIWMDVH